jgi:hypothetical protein
MADSFAINGENVLSVTAVSHALRDPQLKFASCMILNNMCVSDRVMQDVCARCNPSVGTAEFDVDMEPPPNMHEVQGQQWPAHLMAAIGSSAITFDKMECIVRREEWQVLNDKDAHTGCFDASRTFIIVYHCSQRISLIVDREQCQSNKHNN